MLMFLAVPIFIWLAPVLVGDMMIAEEPFLTLGPAAVVAAAILLAVFAILGKPLFAVMGSVAILLYVTADPQYDLTLIFTQMGQIVDQPIFVTIPLFVLAGMLLAESQAPVRLVELSRAFFGWMAGGLAVVATLSCAFFTAFTGTSGVTTSARSRGAPTLTRRCGRSHVSWGGRRS
jgi:TRAP-type mannitol/chloroaromatic compound transport system permease large subunit